MFFWLFMLGMLLLVPAVMLMFGRQFLQNPPGDINAGYGYRTAMSMKNADTWVFAHAYCGRLWVRLGRILLPLSLLAMLPLLGRDIHTVGTLGAAVCLVQVTVMVGSILPVERALRRTFDRNGRRRIPPEGPATF